MGSIIKPFLEYLRDAIKSIASSQQGWAQSAFKTMKERVTEQQILIKNILDTQGKRASASESRADFTTASLGRGYGNRGFGGNRMRSRRRIHPNEVAAMEGRIPE